MKIVLNLLSLLSSLFFPFFTTNAETPVCADDEEIFQLRLITTDDFSSWDGAPASYRVFTESINEVHAECTTNCRNDYPGADIQLCLPRDRCHTVGVGRALGRWISCFNGGTEELLVKWGSKTIRSSNAYFFDRVDFGDGCEANPVCDVEKEVEFEFFFDRDLGNPDSFSWSLTDAVTNEIVYLEGQPYNKPANNTFTYERVCIPRISCLEFYMGYLTNTTGLGYDDSSYSIRLDGVIYSEGNLRMGPHVGFFGGSQANLNKTVILGNNCTVESVCNSADEDLFAMEFTTAAEVECSSPSNDFNFSSAISSQDFPFWMKNDAGTGTLFPNYVWSGDFEDFEVSQSYAFMSCIANDKCTEFYFGTENSVVSYKIFQNGKELTQRVVHSDEDDPSKGLTTTNVGVCASGAGTSSLMYGRFVASTFTILALLNMFW